MNTAILACGRLGINCMTLNQLDGVLSTVKRSQLHMKSNTMNAPLLPAIILDQGHASIAFEGGFYQKKKYSYKHLAKAFIVKDATE